MNKTLLTTIALIVCVTFASAQVKINLPYAKSIGFENGKWSEWPSNYVSIRAEFGILPSLSVKLINDDTFDIELEEVRTADGATTERVLFDPEETKRARKANANDKIMVYKFKDSDNHIWTENLSLTEIANNPSTWRKLEEAKIYFWDEDFGSAYVYANRL